MRRNTMNNSKKATMSGASPNKLQGSTLHKQTTKKALTKGKSPSKKHEDGKEPKESGLATPTSITMQTSFIIKNADDSFDAYHQ